VLYKQTYDGATCYAGWPSSEGFCIQRNEPVVVGDILKIEGRVIMVDAIGQSRAGWFICVTPIGHANDA
jgi:hypothetical protein